MKELYTDRRLSEGFPDLERIGVEYYKKIEGHETRALETMRCLEKLIDFSTGLRTVLVIGCGPNPDSIRELLGQGYDAFGIEPVEGGVEAANEFLSDPTRVRHGSAESLPFPNESQRVVLMESVLEHVDSPSRSVAEAYRVLVPGGVLFLRTVNRLRFSPTGKNPEFRTRFFNWFPALLKECYVHHHLHYDPRLANYTPRPAVHWFTYSDLCRLGREGGFAKFYSLLDLADADTPAIKKTWLRRWLFNKIKYYPWLKAIALTQFGDAVFMLKRP